MSDKTENTYSAEESNDRVGDILRKERITRRIAIETIAKDLKLNVKYIKALESSDFNSLPADPYIRVYLRSLAKYLSLDPEEILSTFYKEKGISSEMEKGSSSKIQVSMQDTEIKKQNPTFIFAIILIILFGAFIFIANRRGWISTPEDHYQYSSTQEEADQELLPEDSLAVIPVSIEADTTEEESPEEAQPAEPVEMNLELSAQRDSVWVQVFSDGQSWKNFIKRNSPRTFTAVDSFNVHVGNNSLLDIKFDGEPLNLGGSGVVTFKLDRETQETWPLSKWNRVFRGRL
ncbi:Transcriptional regulator [Chitinispirillum alkaliphilum]|nr:Transcriptional regulator [Chitinispirillum alkaliphilum]